MCDRSSGGRVTHRATVLPALVILLTAGVATAIAKTRPAPAPPQPVAGPIEAVVSGELALPNEAGAIVPGVLLVDLVDRASAADVEEIEEKAGYRLRRVSDYTQVDRVYELFAPDHALGRIAGRIADDPRVEVVERERVYKSLYAPNDPMFSRQWHMRQVKAPEAWDVSEGKGVTVAVIDTGVAYEKRGKFYQVEDLEGCEFSHPKNFVDGSDHANDDHAHGTHVAGTIAQTTHNSRGVAGVGRSITIMPLKVLDRSGHGRDGPIAQAIRWAADKGARVINMSLGSPFPSREMELACAYAKKKGVTIVCAAGNSGDRGEGVSYPAAFKDCIAVSAVRFDEQKTWYSSYGPQVAIAAPGGDTNVDQDNDGFPDGVWQNTIVPNRIEEQDYLPFQGTSMASPHVAGAAALVVALGVTDPDAVRGVLTSTARPRDNPRFYGAGILDAYAAVKKAGFTYDLYRFIVGIGLTWLLWRVARQGGFKGFLATPGYVAGLLFGGTGLFFLPFLGLGPVPLGHFIIVGFPQWDIALLGAEHHMNPVTYSALVPMLSAIVLFGRPGLRRLLAGFAIGVAAHLSFNALAGVGHMQLTSGLDKSWLAGNAILLFGLALILVRASDEPAHSRAPEE